MLDHVGHIRTGSMQRKKTREGRGHDLGLRNGAKSKGISVSLEKFVGLANILSHIGRYVGPHLVPGAWQLKDIVGQFAICDQLSPSDERIVSRALAPNS